MSANDCVLSCRRPKRNHSHHPKPTVVTDKPQGDCIGPKYDDPVNCWLLGGNPS